MAETYEWRWCKTCGMRIFKDEIEDDTINTVQFTIYSFDCAEDIENEKV